MGKLFLVYLGVNYNLKNKMKESLKICPRCEGKTYVDNNDIIRLKRERFWSPGICNYCLGKGQVTIEFMEKNAVDSMYIDHFTPENLMKIKLELPKELINILDHTSIHREKRFFQYGNYPELFRIANKEETRRYSEFNDQEYLFALCLSFDGDDYYHLVYNISKKGYYIKNGSNKTKSIDRLKYPIKIADKLFDIFEGSNTTEKLIESDDDEYSNYQESSFHQYEIEEKIPSLFNPQKDMRIIFKELAPEQYFSDHKEYSVPQFIEFWKKTNLTHFYNIENFYSTKPYTDDYMEMVNSANINAKETRFLFAEFYQSAFIALIDSNRITNENLATLLKYGIIYNKIDVSDEVYKLLT